MALDYKVENLDAVDENIRSYYEERVEGDTTYYVLGVNGVKPESEFNVVHSTLTKERNLKNDYEKRLKAFGDYTPETIKSLSDELENLKVARTTANEEEFLKRMSEVKETHNKDIQKLRDDYSAKELDFQNQIKSKEREIIDMKLESELSRIYKKKGEDSGFKLAYSLAKQELEWNNDAKEFRAKDGLSRLVDWVDDYLYKEYPCLLKGSYGGGATGSGGSSTAQYDKYFNKSDPNYWSDEYSHKREELFRKDPERGRELAEKNKNKQ